MKLRTWEIVVIAMFFAGAVASSIWYAIGGDVVAMASAIAFAAVTILFSVLFMGSALERRSARESVEHYENGLKMGFESAQAFLAYYNQLNAQNMQAVRQSLTNQGHYDKAMGNVLTNIMKWAVDLGRRMADAEVGAFTRADDDDDDPYYDDDNVVDGDYQFAYGQWHDDESAYS